LHAQNSRTIDFRTGVHVTSRSFSWLATSGGVWDLPSNWDDLTDGENPSQIAPGPQDSVSVMGETGTGIGTITGPGSALFASFLANNALAGTFAFTELDLGDDLNGGLLDIGAATTVTAATGTIASGSLLATAKGGSFAVSGTLTVGAGQFGLGAAACNVDAGDGGVITAAALVLDASSAALYVDPTSLVEIGGTGTAAPGALTIDAGAYLGGQGDANSYADMVNNGIVAAKGGDLRVGTVTGTGALKIGANATLTLNGPTSAAENLVFQAASGTLAFSTEFDVPAGTISGFNVGNELDFLGSPISSATYQSTGSNTGILTLSYGSQVAATLSLLGNYSGYVFLTAGDGALGTLISVTPNYQGGGTLSGGTNSPDMYLWIAPGGGAWDVAANWEDVTAGQSPADIAPGHNNLVTINGPQNQADVIGGPAAAATLELTGDVALGGSFAAGTLTVGISASQTLGTVDLLAGSTLTAASATLADGAFSLAGASTLFAVSGTLTLGGGVSGLGLPINSLYINAGALVAAASLILGGGSGDYITTDTTGAIEIGGTAGATPGTVTVDANGTLSGNGQVNPFGAIVDNGLIDASGGVLVLGSVTGTGTLSIAADSALTLESTTAVPIDFVGANAVLAIASELVAPTSVITGFVPGEIIDILGDPITGVGFTPGSSYNTLTLYYETQAVARLFVAGDYTKDKFLVVPDGEIGSDIEVTGNGGGGGGGGQGNTDLLAWTTPGSGGWGKASYWTDVTLNKPAKNPPGTENPVQVAGPTDGTYQFIGGPGTAASALFTGDTSLGEAYSFGTLTVGTESVAGALALTNQGTTSMAVSGPAFITNGTVALTGATSTLTVGGTLSLGGGAQGQGSAVTLLSAENQASVQVGGLTLGGGNGNIVVTDSTAWIEIGTAGGAAGGAVTVDPGMTVAGNGSLNADASVIDNGTITALGGTLAVGNVRGRGTLAVGVESVLQLTGTEASPISFAGGASTLLLAGTVETPAGIISGFAPGDAIVTGTSPVTMVAYAPGNGGIGTLTMYYDNIVAGTLLLAGNYAGDVFTVVPDGAGAAIGVQQSSGASGGTVTPDDYLWTGAIDSDWNNADNWIDETANQNPANIAPGLNNIDTVQGGAGDNMLTLVGPANAATLTLLGNVALTLVYDIGLLQVGETGNAGALSLGSTAAVVAADIAVIGSLAASGGLLSVAQTLTLGGASGQGVLTAANSSELDLGALVLAGSASAVAVIGTATIEVGTAGNAASGAVTIDAGALATGAGALNVTGQIIDNGTLAASGGTLSVGAVSGTGTLEIGVAASLALEGASAAGVTIDFAGPGSLIIAQASMPASAVADFNSGDTILVPLDTITDVEYAPTGPGIGTLTLYSGTQAEGFLTFLGIGAGDSFSVAKLGGETAITVQQDSAQGGGGGMGQGAGGGDGSGEVENSYTLVEGEPAYLQSWLQDAIKGLTSYVYTSPDGQSWGTAQEGYANIAVVSNPTAYSKVALPPPQQYPAPNYVAILAEGNNPFTLTDDDEGNSLLVGNGGADTIVGNGANDTMVGGSGPGSLFFTSQDATIVGNGNDSIVTGAGNTDVTTSTGRSRIYLGAASNVLHSNGTDTIIASGGTIANDTVQATGSVLVFAPPVGLMNLYAGAGADTVVCTPGGTLRMYGGAGNGGSLWGGGPGSFTQYFGGQGNEIVVGEQGTMYVQGGAGAITMFGGTGTAEIFGTAGPSAYVIGEGASTVKAASGNSVWLVGAANESLVASGGDVLFWGANSAGNNVMQAGNGPITMSGGSGNDTLIAGTGAATMSGGGGGNIFSFTSGLTGGALATDTITDFQVGTDLIALNGYAGGIDAVLETQKISGNTTTYTLPDGTHLILDGIAGLTSGSFTGS
jgi:hypothetical protein